MQTAPMTAAERAAIAASPRVKERLLAKASAMTDQGKAERSVADRIADDMIDIAGGAGHCLDKDLIGRGWTPDALVKHGEEANRIALARAGDGR